MNVIILSLFYTSFSVPNYQIDPPDIFEVEFGLRILERCKKDHKSFCVFSSESSPFNDLRSLNQVISEIVDQDFGLTFHEDEEDSKLLVIRYFEFIRNEERYMKMLVEYIIPDECYYKLTSDQDLSQLIINKLKSNLNNISIESSPELLVLACQSEILFKDLHSYSLSVSRSEQWLSDIMVFNDAIKKSALNSSEKTPFTLLVKSTRKFMGDVLKSIQLPRMHVILCFVSKSIKSDKNHTHEIIRKSYEIIVNELGEDEMCELSSLDKDRLKAIGDKLKIVNGKELSEIERDGVMSGLEYFYVSMQDTISEIDFKMYLANNIYLSPDCGFNSQLFMSQFSLFIKNVSKYQNKGMKIPNFGEMVTTLCLYYNMRNYREIRGSPPMINALPRIIGSYNTIINLLRNTSIELDLYLRLITRIIKEDSRYLEMYIENSYLNKFMFECRLFRFYKNTTNYYEYSKLMHAFLFEYAPIYCANKSSDLKTFADRLSTGLIGVRDDRISTFRNIKLHTDEFLDTSADNIITGPEFYEFETDRCHIKAVNYNLLQYIIIINEKPDHESVNKTIIPICSLFKSVSTVASHYNNPVSTTIWMIILDSSIDLMKKDTFKNLKFDEKLKTLKDYVNDKLKSHSPTQGTSLRIECEIRKILNNGLPDLSSEFLQDLYVHLTAKYPNRNCRLDTSMFSKRTSKLIFHLKKYPGLSDMEDSKIGAYVLFIKRSILDIIRNLRSYRYPDVLAPLLVDNVSCSYHRTSLELNQIITAYNVNIYKGKKAMWMNYVVYHTCLVSRDTKIFISELYENKMLSPEEMEELKNCYKIVLAENQDLSEKNEQNIKAIIDIISSREDFQNCNSNPIKLLLAKCYIRKLHYNIVDESSSTSKTISSSSSTLNSSTQKSSSISTVESHTISKSQSTVSIEQYSTHKRNEDKSKLNLNDDNLTNKSPSKQKLSTGAIIGISIVCIIIIILIIVGIIYLYRKNIFNFTKNRTIKYNRN